MKKILLSIILISCLFFSCKKSTTDESNSNPIMPKDSIITTIAGNGTYGYSGDGGLAINAQFSYNGTYHVAVDKLGNIYVTDAANHCIRKIGSSGIISTIAGNGVSGFAGDGGLATLSRLNSPQGLTLDAAGNIYFCDALNYRIRKISAAGTISTIAGGGTSSLPNAGDGQIATLASLNQPHDVAIDNNGNLLITDWGNHRVRKVSATTNIISTIAGTGLLGNTSDGGLAVVAKVQYPYAITVDASGNIFLSSSYGIKKIDIATSSINTIIGIGSTSVTSLKFNAIGDLLIADYGTGLIWKYDKTGSLAKVAGGAMFYQSEIMVNQVLQHLLILPV